jgi:hypothetical protein
MPDEREFYCTFYAARVWLLGPVEKQRNGEWAIYAMLLEQAGRSPMGCKNTDHMPAGTFVFTRDAYLERPHP